MSRLLAGSTLLLFTLAWAGCRPATQSPSSESSVRAQPRQNPLQTALELIDSMELDSSGAVGPQIKFALNQWLDQEQVTIQWKQDDLVERLPKSLLDCVYVRQIPLKSFNDMDLAYLEEVRWLGSIAKRLQQQPPDSALQSWMERERPDLTEEQRSQLLLAYQLFDWIVRNLQLQDLPSPPDQNTAGPGAAKTAGGEQARPSQMGLPGPGDSMSVAEVLLHGTADAWQRARVLVALAEQCDLPVVILALEDRLRAGKPKPWLPAVLIGGQLYLFDMQLGLPIPGAQEQGIATLSDVLDAPELLRQLDLDEELKYPVAAEDLKRVYALIDANPFALTWRMAALAPHLSGDSQMRLTTQPSATAESVRTCRGIAAVRLWELPYDVYLLRDGLRQRARQSVEARQYLVERSSLFMQMPTLAEGRRRHLQGIFDSRDLSAGSKRIEGAKELYMQSMTSANRIQDLDTNVNLQKVMGLAPLPRENKQMWEQRLEQSKKILGRATNAAKYWMALVHQATGNLAVAQDWLENRVLPEESSDWRPAAQYNLGRIREDLRDFDAARQAYRADTSAQRHGSLWRARRLRRQQEARTPERSSD